MTSGPDRAPDPSLLRQRPLVLVDDLDSPVVGPSDLHHFARVQRIEPGAGVVLTDGRGRWRPARFGPRPEPTGEVAAVAPPAEPVTVAFAPVKGEKPEWFVQKLTELGVDRMVPVVTERTVVRWDEGRRAKVHQRLEIAAREACLQCRRLHLPSIGSPVPLAAFLASDPDATLADPSGRPIGPAVRTLVVGPEGGFGPDELASAPAVALPGHVLRADTAAVVAATAMAGFRLRLW